ncbi:MAG: hypothetical protein NZ693_11350 [Thermoflexales bacterium]|nr:hypothetical protein [Thermoflexales bacterium]
MLTYDKILAAQARYEEILEACKPLPTGPNVEILPSPAQKAFAVLKAVFSRLGSVRAAAPSRAPMCRTLATE